MTRQELEYFDKSYKWWSDFLDARVEALHAMRRLGYSYDEMQRNINSNHPHQVEMILAATKSQYEEGNSNDN